MASALPNSKRSQDPTVKADGYTGGGTAAKQPVASKSIHQKARARTLIAKFAGPQYGKTATRTKWLLDLVCHLDVHFHGEIEAQRVRAEAAESELKRISANSSLNQQLSAERNDALEERVLRAEQRAVLAEQKWAQAQSELANVQDCLRQAAAAAASGAAECVNLQLAFAALSQEERQQKKTLANRTYETRMHLNLTKEQLREHRSKTKAQAIQLEQLHRDAQTAILESSRRCEEAEELAEDFLKSNRKLERKVTDLNDYIYAQERRRKNLLSGKRGSTAAARPQSTPSVACMTPASPKGSTARSKSAGCRRGGQTRDGAARRMRMEWDAQMVGYNRNLYQ